MLAALRRNSRNAIIYVLFGVIIAVFIINFGPGSRGCGGGPAGAAYAAKVGGSTVSEQDFRFAFIVNNGAMYSGHPQQERQFKEILLDKLIERELLAQQAEKLGFAVSAKEAEDLIASGQMIVLGRRMDASTFFKNGKFDYDRFKMVAQNQFGVSVVRFIDIERRELLADKARELLKVGTKVSPEEVKADYDSKGLQVNLDFVRYSPRRYEDEIAEPTDQQIDAYVKAHGDELKKEFEDRAFLYKKIDKQGRLRHIVVDVPKDAKPEQVQAAQKTIDQAAAKVKAGTSFADAAKQYSTDAHSKNRGGLLGWRKKGFTGFGNALDDKVFKAKPGEVIGPEKTDRGFELVKVDQFREGDVPLEVAEKEIAEEKLRDEAAKTKAKAEADTLMAKVKAGQKLDQLVEKGDADAQQQPLALKLSEPPKLNETGLFSRRGDMVQEIGVSHELAKKAFELKQGETAGPFEVAGGYVVVQLKDRKEPDEADFAKRKPEIIREYELTKWAELLDSWSKQRCVETRDDGHIHVNDEILSSEGVLPTRGPAEKVNYQPCAGNRLF